MVLGSIKEDSSIHSHPVETAYGLGMMFQRAGGPICSSLGLGCKVQVKELDSLHVEMGWKFQWGSEIIPEIEES